jgi:hypothetical protein
VTGGFLCVAARTCKGQRADERRRFMRLISELFVHTTICIVSPKSGPLGSSNRPGKPERRPNGLSRT